MRIAIASDHAGYEQKAALVPFLQSLGHEVIDLGPDNAERVDYPDYAVAVGKAVAAGEADKGVLVCGTGIGMARAAAMRAALPRSWSSTLLARWPRRLIPTSRRCAPRLPRTSTRPSRPSSDPLTRHKAL